MKAALLTFSLLPGLFSAKSIFTGDGDWLDSLLWNTGVAPPDTWKQLRCLKIEHLLKVNLTKLDCKKASSYHITDGICKGLPL
jgi:hypothetical protein